MTVRPDRRRLIAGGLSFATLGGLLPAPLARTVDPCPNAGLRRDADTAFAEKAPVALAGAVVTTHGLQWAGVRDAPAERMRGEALRPLTPRKRETS